MRRLTVATPGGTVNASLGVTPAPAPRMKYRKVAPAIWNDSKFRSLDDSGKLVFFLLLTHPSMTALGAMRMTIQGLAIELTWPHSKLGKAFSAIKNQGMAWYDESVGVVWLPNFLRYNVPESPNVIRSWRGAIESLPEGELRDRIVESARVFAEGFGEAFGKAFREAFGKAFAKALANQEQEQEQEPEQEKLKTASAAPQKARLAAGRNGEPAKSTPTFEAYSEAYRKRYGVDPVRNGKVNALLAQLVDRLGAEEAPAVAAFFLRNDQALYVRGKHPVDLLIRDAEGLRTEWATGRRTTETEAKPVAEVALLSESGEVLRELDPVAPGEAQEIARAVLREWSKLIANLSPAFVAVRQGGKSVRFRPADISAAGSTA